jgi:hypothetical protein
MASRNCSELTVASIDTEAPIQFESVEQYQARPNYLSAISCASDHLDRIVGKYVFDEPRKVRCGLNGCNYEHWHGYVIRLKDGRETNIGQDCGKREFKVSFEEVEARYERAVDAAARANAIKTALAERVELLAEAQRLEKLLGQAVSQVDLVMGQLKREPLLLRAFEDAARNGGAVQAAQAVDRDTLDAMGPPSRPTIPHAHASLVRADEGAVRPRRCSTASAGARGAEGPRLIMGGAGCWLRREDIGSEHANRVPP